MLTFLRLVLFPPTHWHNRNQEVSPVAVTRHSGTSTGLAFKMQMVREGREGLDEKDVRDEGLSNPSGDGANLRA